MKKELPAPVIFGVIAVVIAVIVVFGYKKLVPSKPAFVPGGVHVTPPNFATPPGHGATTP